MARRKRQQLYRVLPGRQLSRHPDTEQYGPAGMVPAGSVVDLSHLDKARLARLVGKYVEPVTPPASEETDDGNNQE